MTVAAERTTDTEPGVTARTRTLPSRRIDCHERPRRSIADDYPSSDHRLECHLGLRSLSSDRRPPSDE
ncbi:hypothetical protein [Natronorubrum sp. FCH18a]|uniref:hypothetical protein n=1 Tax=Natronorubrum sp. FCH18a TaxID=3447018 RepID=UPI003F515851